MEQNESNSYIFHKLASRYYVFLNGIQGFWVSILNELLPSDKISIEEYSSPLSLD